MRSTRLNTIIARVALIGWAASMSNGSAQIMSESFTLLTLTNKWHYNPSGTDLHSMIAMGTDWRAPGYNDTDSSLGWDTGGLGPQNGLPLFGFPNQTQLADWPRGFDTLFPDPSFQFPYIVTYYFRTHFNVPTDNLANITLVITNWIDDGVVYWLNGTELTRLRMPTSFTGTNLVYTNLAFANTDQPIADVLIVTPTNLLAGDNVIAAEVHQTTLTSSDEAFGIENMFAIVEQPIVITNQPQSQTAVSGKPFTLTVGGTGSFPFYSWYRIVTNGASTNLLVSGTTNFFYTVASAQAANQGTYFVTITNRFGKVTSSNAALTVVPDTFGPLLLSATVSENNGSVMFVGFDEQVNPLSVTNVSNYTVNLLGTTNVVLVTNAMAFGTSIRLILASPLNPTNQYALVVNNIRDVSPLQNVIAPNSWIGIPIGAFGNVFGFDQSWRYDQDELSTLDPSWTTLNYDDDPSFNPNWMSGVSIFAYSQTGTFHPCAPQNTVLLLGAKTFYFRTKFNLSTSIPTNPILRLSYLVDDGAVFYANGVEILRHNMPVGSVTYDTRASVTVKDALCMSFSTNIGNGILVSGTNVLAVELHQAVPDFGNDVAFGAALSIPYLPKLPPDEPASPALKIVLVDRTTIGLSWGNAHGFALEGADRLSGPWIQVPNMATNMTISASNALQFYRLHKVN